MTVTLPARGTAIAPWRLFRARVAALEVLSPRMRRVRFAGPELVDFADPGYDQRIKLLLGTWPAHTPTDDWYTGWLDLPAEVRPVMRTYTTRRVQVGEHGLTVDVDVVLHDDPGPAGDWVRTAVVGDEVLLVGPDVRFGGDPGGRAFAPPAGVDDVVLVGDESGLPAIARILEDLAETGAPDVRVTALVEVATADECLDLVRPVGAEVVWLVRGDREHGCALGRAVRSWTLVAAGASTHTRSGMRADEPEGDVLWDVPEAATTAAGGVLPRTYFWVAGETAVVRGLRHHLLNEVGLDRGQVALMGYWRRGAPQV